MRQTLFTIPYEIGGVPLFGVGLLLALWAAMTVVVLVRSVRRSGWGAETLGSLPALALLGAVIAFLPRLFPAGLPIRGYGVMMLLGAVSGVALMVYRGRRAGLTADTILSMTFWMFVCGIVGARLFYVIEYWEAPDGQFRRDTLLETLAAIANVPQGGLVVYGSLIGAGVAFVLFVRRRRLPLLALADLLAPSMMIGLAFGRLGCLLNGCCYGGVCPEDHLAHRWAITFPAGSPPYMRQLEESKLKSEIRFHTPDDGPAIISYVAPRSAAELAGLREGKPVIAIGAQQLDALHDPYRTLGEAQLSALRTGEPLTITVLSRGRPVPLKISVPPLPLPPRSLPVQPTQIYSAINATLLFFFLWQFYPLCRRDGEVIALLLTIYPITRFLLEIIRTDESAVFGTGLSISQNVSIGMIVAVAILWTVILRRPRGSALPLAAT